MQFPKIHFNMFEFALEIFNPLIFFIVLKCLSLKVNEGTTLT